MNNLTNEKNVGKLIVGALVVGGALVVASTAVEIAATASLVKGAVKLLSK